MIQLSTLIPPYCGLYRLPSAKIIYLQVLTELERLDIENRLLREMAARYARLMEKEKRTGKL